MTLMLTIFYKDKSFWTFYRKEPVFPFHLIILNIIDYQSKSPDRLYSTIDYENPNNGTTLRCLEYPWGAVFI